MSIRHNPDLLQLTYMKAYADYNDMMEITEQNDAYVCEKSTWKLHKVNYQGTELDLTPPWRILYNGRCS